MKKLIARIVFWGIPIAVIVAFAAIKPDPVAFYLVIIVPVALALMWAYDILYPEPQPDYEI